LNSLRAFEAAARHLNFSRAADELAVTPAAVSHQIKALEDWLGVALFHRRNRAVRLTEAGETLVPGLRQGFDAFAAATERVLSRDRAGELRVTTAPSFAAKWLVPRLARFGRRHPGIDVLLSTTDDVVDLTLGTVDVALRYGRGDYSGLKVTHLMGTDAFPVCSPDLIAAESALKTPADLKHFVLLHDDFTVTWEMWLKTAGVTDVAADRGPRFTDSAMVVQAAVAGQGVALTRGALASDDLAAGRLVKPFDLNLPVDWAYYLVTQPNADSQPKIAAFRDWLLDEVARDRSAQGAARWHP